MTIVAKNIASDRTFFYMTSIKTGKCTNGRANGTDRNGGKEHVPSEIWENRPIRERFKLRHAALRWRRSAAGISAQSVAALRCSRELLRSFCVLPGLPPTAHTVKECAGKRPVSERDVAIFSPPSYSCSFAWTLLFCLFLLVVAFALRVLYTTELPTAYVGYVRVHVPVT